MSDKLEGCPFCKAEMLRYDGYWYHPVSDCYLNQTVVKAPWEIAAWNRRATPTAEPGWQDMESAPRDGEWLLGYSRYGGIEKVRWIESFKEWQDGEGFTFKPTHWMPLPADPPPPQEVE